MLIASNFLIFLKFSLLYQILGFKDWMENILKWLGKNGVSAFGRNETTLEIWRALKFAI